MKNKSKELDVDFIGGQNKPLTDKEQAAISEYIKISKLKYSKKKAPTKIKSRGVSARKNIVA